MLSKPSWLSNITKKPVAFKPEPSFHLTPRLYFELRFSMFIINGCSLWTSCYFFSKVLCNFFIRFINWHGDVTTSWYIKAVNKKNTHAIDEIHPLYARGQSKSKSWRNKVDEIIHIYLNICRPYLSTLRRK